MKDKTIYKQVYFRINAGYKWGAGLGEEELNKFHKDVVQFLEKINFKIISPKHTNSAYEGTREFENLYCHPQSFSGVIEVNQIPVIEQEIKSKRYTSWSFGNTDTYEAVLNYTKEELLQKLEKDKKIIQEEILNSLITKRKNLYRPFTSSTIKDIYVKKYQNSRALSDEVESFVRTQFLEMVQNKQIIESETKVGKCYRADIQKKGRTK